MHGAGDRDGAEDLAQDAWVRAWERPGSFRGDATFGTWMHRLTVKIRESDGGIFLGGGADHGVATRLCHNFHLSDVYYCGTGRLSLPVSHMKRLRVERWWIVLGTLVVTVTVAACDGSVTDVDDAITYQVTRFAIAESFPVQISVTVEITNTSTTPASVTFPDGCVVLMRAYGDGTEPVWDMSGAVGCTQALVQVDLAPGGTEQFQTGLVSAATILGDNLPNGNYRITAYLRPGEIVELDVGTVDLAVP